mmetsp:Transcript_21884/g.22809  ORF Transcript_21884/g.22809 Transcript_21884/m.22809 type:complete len:221 (-) Transcript_21884:30-692(-)
MKYATILMITLICLCIVGLVESGDSATYKQVITYINYTPASGSTPDFHTISIKWYANDDSSAVPWEDSDTPAWKYSLVRDTSADGDSRTKGDETLFERYSVFLPGIDGYHHSKYYVAWITAADFDCEDADTNMAGDIVNLTIKVKFFMCQTGAQDFYDNNTYLNLAGNNFLKALVDTNTSTPIVSSATVLTTSVTSASVNVGTFTQLLEGDETTIGNCIS